MNSVITITNKPESSMARSKKEVCLIKWVAHAINYLIFSLKKYKLWIRGDSVLMRLARLGNSINSALPTVDSF
jgi:hypothetical protein